MKVLFRLTVIVFGSLMLTACSYLYGSGSFYRQKENEYLKSRPVAPLVIPGDLSRNKISANYAIPNTIGSINKPLNLAPPGSLLAQHEARNPRARGTYIPSSPTPLIITRQVDGAGYPYLLVRRTAKPTWNLVGVAIRRAGYNVVNRNTAKMRYTIVDVQAKKSKQINVSPVYVLHIDGRNKTSSTIEVTNEKNHDVSNDAAERVLNNIKDGMQNKSSLSFEQWFKGLL